MKFSFLPIREEVERLNSSGLSRLFRVPSASVYNNKFHTPNNPSLCDLDSLTTVQSVIDTIYWSPMVSTMGGVEKLLTLAK